MPASIRLASSTSCSAVSSAVLPMVLRYTRTRSVDTRPLVSGSRRGERTPRVSLGEDCSSVTMGLRPCLRFGCIRGVVFDGGGASRRQVRGDTRVVRTGPWLFCPMWYALHNGSHVPSCSTNGPFTANRQGVCSVTPTYPPRRASPPANDVRVVSDLQQQR